MVSTELLCLSNGFRVVRPSITGSLKPGEPLDDLLAGFNVESSHILEECLQTSDSFSLQVFRYNGLSGIPSNEDIHVF